MGDDNCDGAVTGLDAVSRLRVVSAIDEAPIAGDCSATGDTNCSGDADPADVLGILRFVAGLESEDVDCLPVGAAPVWILLVDTVGDATVSLNGEQICDSDCESKSILLPHGEDVTLTGAQSWWGCDQQTGDACEFTLTNDRAVVATGELTPPQVLSTAEAGYQIHAMSEETLSKLIRIEGTTYIFPSAASEVGGWQAGDVVYNSITGDDRLVDGEYVTGEGDLIKVASRTEQGDEIRVATEEANLADVFSGGGAVFSESSGRSSQSADAAGVSLPARVAEIEPELGVNCTLADLYCELTVDTGSSAGLSLDGKVWMDLDPYLSVEFANFFVCPFCVETAEVRAGISAGARVEAAWGAQLKIPLEKEFHLATAKVVIPFGPVPIPVFFDFNVTLKFDAEATLAFTASADASFSASVGAKYTRASQRWSPTSSFRTNSDFDLPLNNPKLKAEARVHVIPNVEVRVFGAPGPGFNLDSSIGVDLDFNRCIPSQASSCDSSASSCKSGTDELYPGQYLPWWYTDLQITPFISYTADLFGTQVDFRLDITTWGVILIKATTESPSCGGPALEGQLARTAGGIVCSPAEPLVGQNVNCSLTLPPSWRPASPPHVEIYWRTSENSSLVQHPELSTTFASPGPKNIYADACLMVDPKKSHYVCRTGYAKSLEVYPKPAIISPDLGCAQVSDTLLTVTCKPDVLAPPDAVYAWSSEGGNPATWGGSSYSVGYGTEGEYTISLELCDSSGKFCDTLTTEVSLSLKAAVYQIAFRSTRDDHFGDIYTIFDTGAGGLRLTDNAGFDADPEYSPDGTKIAFSSEQDGKGVGQIYVMNADGSDQRRLTAGFNHHNDPTWSPDGTKIAFTTWDHGFHIYVMNASDGSEVTRLTDGGDNTRPAWSPDGSEIAFLHSDAETETTLWVMKVNNPGGAHRLLPASWSGANLDSESAPAWGTGVNLGKIAFSAAPSTEPGPPNYNIYAMKADGTGPVTALTDTPFFDREPAWSPEGTKLAFSSNRDGGSDIYLFESGGPPRQSGFIRITFTGDNHQPDYQCAGVSAC
ncbi:MAG TPA: hypothetical protein VIT93_07010 [Dehalococcoidia bacterium]